MRTRLTDSVAASPGVVAHRGAWHPGVPENSLPAFERAIDLGADMIEFDIRRARDGELIILHDGELAGTAASVLTRVEIAAAAGVLPPRLEDVLELAAGRIALDAELKEDGYVDEVAERLAEFAAAGGELIVTSFSDLVLAQLAELTPQLRLGLLVEQSAQRTSERARACGAALVLPQMKLVDEALIAETSQAGLALVVWDFTATEHAAVLSDARVSGVITDDVPGALAARGVALAGAHARRAPAVP